MKNRTCPRCSGDDLTRSRTRNAVERVLKSVGVAPYRCRDCSRRFFRFFSPAAGRAAPTTGPT